MYPMSTHSANKLNATHFEKWTKRAEIHLLITSTTRVTWPGHLQFSSAEWIWG